jgi:hypothetical protein
MSGSTLAVMQIPVVVAAGRFVSHPDAMPNKTAAAPARGCEGPDRQELER